MNNIIKETELQRQNGYLDIEDYIDFACKNLNNLNNLNTDSPSYEEVFISEESINDYKIDYENYIEEALGEQLNKKFNNISTNEYYELIEITFGEN